jgi:hypothetical protein
MAASVMSALRDGLAPAPLPTGAGCAAKAGVGNSDAIVAAVRAAASSGVADAIEAGRVHGWVTAIADDTLTMLESADDYEDEDVAGSDTLPLRPPPPTTARRVPSGSDPTPSDPTRRDAAPGRPAAVAVRRPGRTGRGNFREDGHQAGLLAGASANIVSAAAVSSVLVQQADAETNAARQDERAVVGNAAADLLDAAWCEAGL